ncbi:PaaI family thioesterase [Aquabacterium sp.]|uniref:PaaI family thioesterase n=1 Tax=Aquabacterium sp. TaxID=1872578 RepID=UPI002487D00C|nr:PaaI family thioesterase [Aquabacterium sp.]MDI1348199.1 PaaI family thioesterase [Aquabacterium sp.]
MTRVVKSMTDCAEAAMVLVPAVPFHRFLGMREEVVEGETRYLMDFCENHVGNPLIRTFHGGVLASFGEVVAATHLARSLARVELPACSTLTFDYLRPAFAGTICAVPHIVRAGRRITTVSVQLRLDNKLACIGRFLFPVGTAGLIGSA